MGLLQKIQAKTEEARAKEKIRPLLESRMMRDILLEIGQRGNEALDPQSVPLAMRRRATQLASESGLSGLKQCAVDELHLDEAGITLVCKGEHTAFLYADYNYENIEDTDCLPLWPNTWCSTCAAIITLPAAFTVCPKPTAMWRKRPAR